jgi:hypothetical protein
VSPREAGYEDRVFVNCPFDEPCRPLFQAMVFAVHDAGFVARCALEVSDATENRLGRIFQIVAECRYGIHDISRTEPGKYRLPRFNMPLELGIFLGAKRFGGPRHRTKGCLILDRRPYRYQRFISDIAGQDVYAHHDRPQEAVEHVRDWLRTASRRRTIPGGPEIWRRYQRFRRMLPEMCSELGLNSSKLIFADYVQLAEVWLEVNAP